MQTGVVIGIASRWKGISPRSAVVALWYTLLPGVATVYAGLPVTVGAARPSSAGVWINVMTAPYNAVGDGSTNDRPAIQAAIVAAAANSGGGTVELPAGHTFLTGDLQLLSGVTLNIDSGATLKQSNNPAHYAHTPSFGRWQSTSIAFDAWSETNYPLVFAGQASNVTITGGGTIQMSYTGDDATTIMENAVGFNQVSGFTLSNVTVTGAMAYNFAVRNSDHGEISNVTTTNPASLNSDGVSLMNCSYINVHDSNLTTMDDAVYVWASYLDPRASAWWDSNTPRPSHDINIYSNVIHNVAGRGSHGFAFINWTAAAPDQSAVEVSRINVHDNQFNAPYPVGALVSDPYHSPPRQEKTPTKDLTFKNNTLTVITDGSAGAGGVSQNLNEMATTDFSGDNAIAYNVGLATDATGLYNSDFDGANAFSAEVGTSFWSTEGNAITSNTAVGQPGGNYGVIQGFENGYAGIYQGVYLQPGVYTFTAAVQSSGLNIRLFAIQASNLAVLPGTILFNNTDWQTLTITFTVTQSDTYRLGIDDIYSFGCERCFGRIDSTRLTRLQ